MKCVLCRHGETSPGLATLTFTRDAMTLVVRDVPAAVCANCGEEYVESDVTARLLDAAEKAARNGIQVEVRSYTAA
jgi:YgiT-type zinc finger domain-containing protein